MESIDEQRSAPAEATKDRKTEMVPPNRPRLGKRMACAVLVLGLIGLSVGTVRSDPANSQGIPGQIAALQAAVAALQSQVSSLQNTVATQTNQNAAVTTLQTQVSALQNTVATQANQITTLQGQVVTLQNTVATQGQQITAQSQQIGQLQTDLATETAARQQGDTDTLSAAKSYTDSGDATTLTAAKTYADAGDATTLASAKSYTDSGDATTLAAAKTYSDGGDQTTLTSANANTNRQISSSSNPFTMTQTTTLQSLTQYLSVSGTDITFSGANLHIVNGMGHTETTNGLGNLTIGYNEDQFYEGTPLPHTETGSHNLILGDQNDYSSFGGIVAGQRNQIIGQFATVAGGELNIAKGDYSVVSGGYFSEARGTYSTVSGGENIVLDAFDGWDGGTYHTP